MEGTFGALRSRQPSRPKTVNIKGVPVRILFGPDNSPELEIIKQMLKARQRLDFAIVIAGSMNYTQPANEYNDENIFVIGNPYDLPKSKGGPVDHQECKAITSYFRSEIDRIITKSTVYR